MNTEMTVYGIPSKDTMTVTNRANSLSEEDSSHAMDSILNVSSAEASHETSERSDRSDRTDRSDRDSNWNCSANCSANCSNDQTFANPDEALQPIERLEKYSSSEIIFHRQVVARSILETLSDVQQSDTQRVMIVISRLSSDTEPSIRAELVEQLPHIASYCCNQLHNLSNLVPHYILPILEQFLTDTNSQVRKITQNAFVMMLEQGLIKIDFLEERICPLLIQLTDFSNLDDYRMESVGMMGKIVRFLGKDVTEKLLLHSFNRLCLDVSFHVRRICAANFGDFCSIVGQEITENILLPQFRRLCKDSIWGVRKSCADVFVPVALVVSNKVRQELLAPAFVSLLNDGSRWVKTAAFQALGPFISTFADPSKTGLYYSESGIVVIEDHNSNDSGCSAGSESTVDSPTEIEDETEDVSVIRNYLVNLSFDNNNITDTVNKEANDLNNSEFSQFFYWRVPILDLPVDELLIENSNQKVIDSSFNNVFSNIEKDIKENELDSDDLIGYDESIDSNSNCVHSLTPNINDICMNFDDQSFDLREIKYTNKNKKIANLNEDISSIAQINPLSYGADSSIAEPLLGIYSNKAAHDDYLSIEDYKTVSYGYNNSFQYRRPAPTQDIIPNDLLEHYLSMTNPIHYQTIDPDLTHHCAYSLPAVALTLGRQNWPCLRETYELLAAEMQWKVRWTLASSLHQMSLILGADLTTRDLLPIFLTFMKDLDEVRYGILQNLSSFLKLLLRPQQLGILPKISEFLKMDNNRNWRFRFTLAEQLTDLANIYTASEIKEYLLPIGLVLLVDKVSEVRMSAIRVISVLIKQIFQSESNLIQCNDNIMEIIYDLNSHFANSSKWIHRKTYIILCEKLIEENSLPLPLFIDCMLDHLLNMSTDQVPNIRLVLARCITRTLWPIAQFRSHLRVQQTLEDLQEDKDDDVRYLSILNGIVSESINAENNVQNSSDC